jgi:hypothetical protein
MRKWIERICTFLENDADSITYIPDANMVRIYKGHHLDELCITLEIFKCEQYGYGKRLYIGYEPEEDHTEYEYGTFADIVIDDATHAFKKAVYQVEQKYKELDDKECPAEVPF